MITRIEEHDKLHLSLDCAIVLAKILCNLLNEDFEVWYLPIDPLLNVDAVHIISKDKSLSVVDLFLGKGQGLTGLACKNFVKPGSVWVVTKSITEHSLVLVDPETRCVHWLVAMSTVGDAETLSNPGDVSEVEGVVRLVGCWLQGAVEDLVVDTECHGDQWCNRILNLLTKVIVEGSDDGGEDLADTLVSELCVGQDVEVTLDTSSDNGSSSTWWSHSSHEDDILNPVEWLFLGLSIVPATVIEPLS